MFPASSRHHSESLSNPLYRMRRERHVALILFNVLLLLAACIQLFSLALSHPLASHGDDPASAVYLEWEE